MQRESMQYDVVIVGTGQAGLSAAIHLKQLAVGKGTDMAVCVLEKGSGIGAHILSGAVMDPRAMTELFPNWKELGAPLNVSVTEDRFLFLTESKAYRAPNRMLPDCFRTHAWQLCLSLGNVVRGLDQRAESRGVEIFPGFAVAEVLYNDDGAIKGVAKFKLKDRRDMQGRSSVIAQRACTSSSKATMARTGCRSMRRTVCTARRTTQGLNAEHRLGHTRRGWRTELSTHVRCAARVAVSRFVRPMTQRAPGQTFFQGEENGNVHFSIFHVLHK